MPIFQNTNPMFKEALFDALTRFGVGLSQDPLDPLGFSRNIAPAGATFRESLGARRQAAAQRAAEIEEKGQSRRRQMEEMLRRQRAIAAIEDPKTKAFLSLVAPQEDFWEIYQDHAPHLQEPEEEKKPTLKTFERGGRRYQYNPKTGDIKDITEEVGGYISPKGDKPEEPRYMGFTEEEIVREARERAEQEVKAQIDQLEREQAEENSRAQAQGRSPRRILPRNVREILWRETYPRVLNETKREFGFGSGSQSASAPPPDSSTSPDVELGNIAVEIETRLPDGTELDRSELEAYYQEKISEGKSPEQALAEIRAELKADGLL